MCVLEMTTDDLVLVFVHVLLPDLLRVRRQYWCRNWLPFPNILFNGHNFSFLSFFFKSLYCLSFFDFMFWLHLSLVSQIFSRKKKNHTYIFTPHVDWYMVRFMVLNATFNNISAISWRQFYWWKKPGYPEKTTDLSQVTDKFIK